MFVFLRAERMNFVQFAMVIEEKCIIYRITTKHTEASTWLSNASHVNHAGRSTPHQSCHRQPAALTHVYGQCHPIKARIVSLSSSTASARQAINLKTPTRISISSTYSSKYNFKTQVFADQYLKPQCQEHLPYSVLDTIGPEKLSTYDQGKRHIPGSIKKLLQG